MKSSHKILTILLLTLCLVGSAMAALPPLSPERQNELASDVVRATVLKVDKKTITVANGTDTLYTLQLKVSGVEKGELKPGQTITTTCQSTGKRPEFWVGPQGQNLIPVVDDEGTFFLTSDGEEGYQLLKPNGWKK